MSQYVYDEGIDAFIVASAKSLSLAVLHRTTYSYYSISDDVIKIYDLQSEVMFTVRTHDS